MNSKKRLIKEYKLFYLIIKINVFVFALLTFVSLLRAIFYELTFY